jgi:hypothetical protein
MDLGCHDWRLMSSLAFGREWIRQAKLFCVKDFAGLKAVALFSGSVAAVTGGSSIAATIVVLMGVDSIDGLQTSDISRASKESSITGIVREPTGNVDQHCA